MKRDFPKKLTRNLTGTCIKIATIKLNIKLLKIRHSLLFAFTQSVFYGSQSHSRYLTCDQSFSVCGDSRQSSSQIIFSVQPVSLLWLELGQGRKVTVTFGACSSLSLFSTQGKAPKTECKMKLALKISFFENPFVFCKLSAWETLPQKKSLVWKKMSTNSGYNLV